MTNSNSKVPNTPTSRSSKGKGKNKPASKAQVAKSVAAMAGAPKATPAAPAPDGKGRYDNKGRRKEGSLARTKYRARPEGIDGLSRVILADSKVKNATDMRKKPSPATDPRTLNRFKEQREALKRHANYKRWAAIADAREAAKAAADAPIKEAAAKATSPNFSHSTKVVDSAIPNSYGSAKSFGPSKAGGPAMNATLNNAKVDAKAAHAAPIPKVAKAAEVAKETVTESVKTASDTVKHAAVSLSTTSPAASKFKLGKKSLIGAGAALGAAIGGGLYLKGRSDRNANR